MNRRGFFGRLATGAISLVAGARVLIPTRIVNQVGRISMTVNRIDEHGDFWIGAEKFGSILKWHPDEIQWLQDTFIAGAK